MFISFQIVMKSAIDCDENKNYSKTHAYDDSSSRLIRSQYTCIKSRGSWSASSPYILFGSD